MHLIGIAKRKPVAPHNKYSVFTSWKATWLANVNTGALSYSRHENLIKNRRSAKNETALLHEMLTASRRLNSRVPCSRAQITWRGAFVNNSLASVHTWIQIHEQQLTSDAEYHFFILLRERHFNLIKTKMQISNRGFLPKLRSLCFASVGRGKKRTLSARRAERWGDLFYTVRAVTFSYRVDGDELWR
jgi:hypothetical protein